MENEIDGVMSWINSEHFELLDPQFKALLMRKLRAYGDDVQGES